MNLRSGKGSIAIFVLITLLFMSSFLIISFANNVNKSKVLAEQVNMISQIYTYSNGDDGAYDKSYTDLRKKNRQKMTVTTEGQDEPARIELEKTFAENTVNYRIYGNESGLGRKDVQNEAENLFNLDYVMTLSNWTLTEGAWEYVLLNLEIGKSYTISATTVNNPATSGCTFKFGRLKDANTFTSLFQMTSTSESTTIKGIRRYSFTATGKEALYVYVPYKLNETKLKQLLAPDDPNVMPDVKDIKIRENDLLGVGDKVNLLDNTKWSRSDNIYEDWELTETGLKQTKIHNTGYKPRVLYDITDIVKPNTTYYYHADIIRNFTVNKNPGDQISGSFRIYVDGRENGKLLQEILATETTRAKTFTTPATFSKIEIYTWTVPGDESITDFDADKIYSIEFENIYLSEMPYEEYVPYGKYKIPIVISNDKKEEGENLLDLSKFENGTLATNGGNYTKASRARSNFMFLEAGEYTISSTGRVRCGDYLYKYTQPGVSYFKESLTITKTIIEDKVIGTVTLDEDCYVRINFAPLDETEITDLSKDTIANYNPKLIKNNNNDSGIDMNSSNTRKVNIYLDSPLYKGEYVDFKLKRAVKSNGIDEHLDLPELLTLEDYTIIEAISQLKPSKMELEYMGYTLD